MKLLKLVLPFSVNLSTGRSDITNFSLSPANSTVPYYDIVVENSSDANYNKLVIDAYISNGVLTILELSDPMPSIVFENYAVSLHYPNTLSYYNHPEFFPDDPLGFAYVPIQWPITFAGSITSFNFTQDNYIPDMHDSTDWGIDSFVLTANNMSNGFIDITAVFDPYPKGSGKYQCTATINGKSVSAVITIEYITDGS